jgi:uncharacterized membrane protein
MAATNRAGGRPPKDDRTKAQKAADKESAETEARARGDAWLAEQAKALEAKELEAKEAEARAAKDAVKAEAELIADIREFEKLPPPPAEPVLLADSIDLHFVARKPRGGSLVITIKPGD